MGMTVNIVNLREEAERLPLGRGIEMFQGAIFDICNEIDNLRKENAKKTRLLKAADAVVESEKEYQETLSGCSEEQEEAIWALEDARNFYEAAKREEGLE
jgi:hypothetical protein